MRSPRLTAPLRRPLFRRLAITYSVNEMGDWMGLVALSVLVFDRTGSAMATAGLFVGTKVAPAIVAPLLVARAEQPAPRLVLPAIYVGEAAAFGALALLSTHFSLAPVLVVGAIDGALALTGRSLTRAVTVALLGPTDELRAGNAVLNVAFTGSAAVGPAVAGLVVAGLDVQTALLLDAASFCLVAWILLTAGELPRAAPDPGRMRERLRAGFAYIRRAARLRRLIVAEGIAFVFFSAALPIEVIYAEQTLGTGDAGYGFLIAAWGVGMVIGSLVFATARRAPLPQQLFFSTLAVGAGYLGLAVAPTLAVASLAAVLGGTGNGVQWVAMVSAIQELTAASMQARVMSVLESVGAVMPGVGFLLGGGVATLLSPRAALFVAAAGIFAVVAVFSVLLGRNWGGDGAVGGEREIDAADDEVMVELIPAEVLPSPDRRPLT
jgi:MFS family permease